MSFISLLVDKETFPPCCVSSKYYYFYMQMGLTVVKEIFFSPWLVTALFTLVIPFINTFKLILAPSRFLMAKLLEHLSAFQEDSLQQIHKLKQKLKLTLTVLVFFPVKHHPSFPSSQRGANFSEYTTYIPKKHPCLRNPYFVCHFTLNPDHGTTQKTV